MQITQDLHLFNQGSWHAIVARHGSSWFKVRPEDFSTATRYYTGQDEAVTAAQALTRSTGIHHKVTNSAGTVLRS